MFISLKFLLFFYNLSLILISNSYAVCNTDACPNNQANNRTAEVKRIRGCITHYARNPLPTEQTIFTYGHTHKMSSMENNTQAQFTAFEYARQSKFEQARFRATYAIMIKNKPNYRNNINHILTYANKYNLNHQDLLALKIAFTTNKNDIKPAKQKQLRGLALQFAALEKVYPGFLDKYQTNFDDERRELTTSRNAIVNLDELRRFKLDGELLALQLANVQGARLSSSTGGRGVYLGENPFDFVEHFAGGGKACTLLNNPIILDISDTEVDGGVFKCLVQAQVLVPNRNDPILRPNSNHNFYAHPDWFEEAARGFLIKFRSGDTSPIVDKDAIDYQQCRNIDINHFIDDNCQHLSALFAGFNKTGFLAFMQRNVNFPATFFNALNRCSCDMFISLVKLMNSNKNSDLTQYVLGTVNAQNFKVRMRTCGCKYKRPSSFWRIFRKIKRIDCKPSKCIRPNFYDDGANITISIPGISDLLDAL